MVISSDLISSVPSKNPGWRPMTLQSKIQMWNIRARLSSSSIWPVTTGVASSNGGGVEKETGGAWFVVAPRNWRNPTKRSPTFCESWWGENLSFPLALVMVARMVPLALSQRNFRMLSPRALLLALWNWKNSLWEASFLSVFFLSVFRIKNYDFPWPYELWKCNFSLIRVVNPRICPNLWRDVCHLACSSWSWFMIKGYTKAF